MILDSNILIYSLGPDGPVLDRYVEDSSAALSVISFVEVLGFHRLESNDRSALESLFAELPVYSLSPPIIDRAIHLRQQRKMGLPDAVIAATALVHDRTLVTRNTADFAWVPGLKLVNPFEASPAT